MKRRTFIMAAVATSVVVAIPAVYYSSRRKKISGDPLGMPYVLDRFCTKKEIYNIGVRYRSQAPSENTKEKLTELLLSNNKGKKIESMNKSAIAELLKEKIQEEFSAYKTIIVNGWVISATEARQCALFSLAHN